MLIILQTFEVIKHTQVGKWNRAETEEEKSKIECDPLEILHKAVDNCKPVLITTKIVKGGVTYQVNMMLNHDNAFSSL